MMTQAPTDRGNFDVLGAVAAEMVNDRQYGQVQSAMDDLSAAERQGTPLPGTRRKEHLAWFEYEQPVTGGGEAGDA